MADPLAPAVIGVVGLGVWVPVPLTEEVIAAEVPEPLDFVSVAAAEVVLDPAGFDVTAVTVEEVTETEAVAVEETILVESGTVTVGLQKF